jgi:probable rRNA maturation factor
MGIEVFVADEQSDGPVDLARWTTLAHSVLAAERVRDDAELSVIFVDEAYMAHLNRKFLDKEGPTDVLAFPIDEDPAPSGRSPDSGGTGPGWVPPDPVEVPSLVGDVVICPAVALRNASEGGGSYEDEIAMLLVHGILHLSGMDHVDDEEAEEMERREQELLEEFYRKSGRHRRRRAGGAGPVGEP